MICSARTGSKSGSNWLDRLRSNKGIPTGDDDIDLDSFLLRLNTHSHSPQIRPTNPARPRPTEARDLPLTTLLAEIFNPGATLTLTSKKCPRKQTNPKFFLASSSVTNAPPPTSTTGDAAVAVEIRGNDEEENENDEEDMEDMKGFTRSEVTVIDTSCHNRKVDKFVFRKNSVWKVRERKQKIKNFAKKKSKTNRELDIHGIGNSKDNVVNVGGEKAVKKQKVIYSTS